MCLSGVNPGIHTQSCAIISLSSLLSTRSPTLCSSQKPFLPDSLVVKLEFWFHGSPMYFPLLCMPAGESGKRIKGGNKAVGILPMLVQPLDLSKMFAPSSFTHLPSDSYHCCFHYCHCGGNLGDGGGRTEENWKNLKKNIKLVFWHIWVHFPNLHKGNKEPPVGLFLSVPDVLCWVSGYNCIQGRKFKKGNSIYFSVLSPPMPSVQKCWLHSFGKKRVFLSWLE